MRALKSAQQLREIFERLDLARNAKPFIRCLHCNTPLRAIDKALVLDRVPPAVLERYEQFRASDSCKRVFWEGSHWRRMRALVDQLMPSC